MSIDIHALANSRGFGSAQKALQKAGMWDEYRGLPEKEFRVRVQYEIRHDATETVTVNARCDKEAEEKACQRIEDDHDYDVEFDQVEVLK